jgi:hypothetical protein
LSTKLEEIDGMEEKLPLMIGSLGSCLWLIAEQDIILAALSGPSPSCTTLFSGLNMLRAKEATLALSWLFARVPKK